MALEIFPVAAASDLEAFVDFPFSLHAQSPLWTPPLKKQELALLTPGEHPFWETARRALFMARREGKTVGRIAAVIDAKYNAYASEDCGAFGFFECENDPEVANTLLDAARTWLIGQGAAFMRGPLNPSANYSCGLLVHGFDEPPAVMMPWNPPYYASLIEKWGMRKEEDLFAYVVERAKLQPKGWLAKEVARLKAENKFTCRASSKATMDEDIRAMLELYRVSWADNWGFSPLSPSEANEYIKELKDVVDPDFFVLFFHEDKPVAGMVALPDMAPLLRRLKGKVGITAPWHFWQSRKEIKKGLRTILFGILPQYRLYGLPLLLLNYMLETARSKPALDWVEGSWILERNLAMNDLMEDFSGRLAKRYRIYRRELAPC